VLVAETGLQRSLVAEPAVCALFADLSESWGPELRYFVKEPQPTEAKTLSSTFIRWPARAGPIGAFVQIRRAPAPDC